MRFPQNGKVAEIFAKVGDRVEAGQVLASLDKREFYQELSQAESKIQTTKENISKEIEKAHGPESRKLDREIASMERKLAEMEADLQKAVQDSPYKAKDKNIDLNTKKQELEIQKNKYTNDLLTYETEKKNSEKIIASKVEESQKSVRKTMQDMSSEYSDMKNIHRDMNTLFAFTTE